MIISALIVILTIKYFPYLPVTRHSQYKKPSEKYTNLEPC